MTQWTPGQSTYSPYRHTQTAHTQHTTESQQQKEKESINWVLLAAVPLSLYERKRCFMRSQTTQLNWKVFQSVMAKRCHLAVNQPLLADWSGPCALSSPLFSWRYTGAVARFVNGQSIESDDDGSNWLCVSLLAPSHLLIQCRLFSIPSEKLRRLLQGAPLFFFFLFPPSFFFLLLLSPLSLCVCVSIWRALCVGAAPSWRKEVGKEREREREKRTGRRAIDFPSAREKRS